MIWERRLTGRRDTLRSRRRRRTWCGSTAQPGLAMKTDCTRVLLANRSKAASRRGGALQLVRGRRPPLAITNCLKLRLAPRPRSWLRCRLRGKGAACRALDFHIVSGNVAFTREQGDRRAAPSCPRPDWRWGLLDDLERMATISSGPSESWRLARIIRARRLCGCARFTAARMATAAGGPCRRTAQRRSSAADRRVTQRGSRHQRRGTGWWRGGVRWRAASA